MWITVKNFRAGGREEGYLGTIEKLHQSIKKGLPEPEVKPKCLALNEMVTATDVFQHRSGNLTQSEAHVAYLTKVLERNDEKTFTPLTVYWIGETWCCIDGHHRLKAYQAEREMWNTVPVQVFSGTLDSAIGKALEGNSKDKLPMQRQEKSGAAWRLVVGTSLSKAAQARASGVSESQIAVMRRTKAYLIGKGWGIGVLADMRWYEAMLLAQGRPEFDQKGFDDYVEEQRQLLANRLTKAFGKRLTSKPEILAKALSICNECLPTSLIEAWTTSGFLTREDFVEESEEDINL